MRVMKKRTINNTKTKVLCLLDTKSKTAEMLPLIWYGLRLAVLTWFGRKLISKHYSIS
jgi:hypothetical protein